MFCVLVCDEKLELSGLPMDSEKQRRCGFVIKNLPFL